MAFLVRNTMDHFVLKYGNQRASLFAHPDGPFLGLTLQLPNKLRLRILNYYGLPIAATKKWQDAFVETQQYDVIIDDFNDSIWSNTPSRVWHNNLLNRRLYDPLQELYPDGSVQAGHTRGCHRLDAILVSSRCCGNVSPMTYHIVAMPTSDHRLVPMTTGLTSAAASPSSTPRTLPKSGMCGKSELPFTRHNTYSPGKTPQWTQYHALMRSLRRWRRPSFDRGSAPSGSV